MPSTDFLIAIVALSVSIVAGIFTGWQSYLMKGILRTEKAAYELESSRFLENKKAYHT